MKFFEERSMDLQDVEPLDLMSNYDGAIIDQESADQIKSTAGMRGYHFGWNFCGYVSYDRNTSEWIEDVWCYGSQRATLRFSSLEDLRDLVNDQFGWD